MQMFKCQCIHKLVVQVQKTFISQYKVPMAIDWYITDSLKDRTIGFEQSKKLKMQISKCYKLP